MSIHQTQEFTPEVNAAYLHLSEIMSGGVTDLTFASLNKGVVDPDVAKAASDRIVRRATKAYAEIVASVPPREVGKVLATILAELTISTTATWVVATHTAINSGRKDTDA